MAEVFSVFVALDMKVKMRGGNLEPGILKFLLLFDLLLLVNDVCRPFQP